MKRIRCVVDTNVLISASLRYASFPRKIVEQVLEYGELLFSEEIIREFISRISNERKFGKYVSLEKRILFAKDLILVSSKIPVTQHIEKCRDPALVLFSLMQIEW